MNKEIKIRLYVLLGIIVCSGLILIVDKIPFPEYKRPEIISVVILPATYEETRPVSIQQLTEPETEPGELTEVGSNQITEQTATEMEDPELIEESDSNDISDASYKSVRATVFWVGEEADSSNGFIANDDSFWDSSWIEHYGGYDDPDDRCGYYPCEFTPHENPFYIALPYGDLIQGKRKASAKNIPWVNEIESLSILKNVWVEILYDNTVCYAQWEDVGPFESDDFQYVFGDAEPSNTFGAQAGIDVSPAVRDCLGLRGNDIVSWKFVSSESVPLGPWLGIVTTRGVSY